MKKRDRRKYRRSVSRLLQWTERRVRRKYRRSDIHSRVGRVGLARDVFELYVSVARVQDPRAFVVELYHEPPAVGSVAAARSALLTIESKRGVEGMAVMQ